MKISRPHGLGKEEAKRRIDSVAGDLGAQFGISGAWRGDSLAVSGNGVNGHIAVTDNRVDVDVKLGFALLMLEGTIRSAVENAMDRHLT